LNTQHSAAERHAEHLPKTKEKKNHQQQRWGPHAAYYNISPSMSISHKLSLPLRLSTKKFYAFINFTACAKNAKHLILTQ